MSTDMENTQLLTEADTHAIDKIHSYWFGEIINTWSKSYPLNTKLWFKTQETVDRYIKEQFEPFLLAAVASDSSLYGRWQTTDRGKLALILLLDQFSRHMYRGTAKMFEYDPLALQIALDIIAHPTYIDTYSLPERLFVYLPLVHSENLVHATKGAQLLEALVPQVTRRDIRRRYETSAQAAQSDRRVIELFGRYPDRNGLLGRQSTADEEIHLSKAGSEVSPSEPKIKSDLRAADASSNDPHLRILVLHGSHQNSNSLKRSAKKVFKNLKGIATFYFANAPLPCNPTGDVKGQLLAPFGEDNSPNIDYQRQWWNASTDSKIYHHLDVTLHYLDKLFKSEGPFDGVLGFSQGAALGGILSGLQPFGNISFQFAILISGFASCAECHERIMQPKAIRNVPSLHIHGVKDAWVTSDRTLKLAEMFDNAAVISHSGGHFTPNTWPVTDMKQFLLEQQTSVLQKDGAATNIHAYVGPSLNTFEEKLQATIAWHQKQLSTLSAAERKAKRLPVLPIGLSVLTEAPNLDDLLLLVWCKRTTFHNAEPKSDDHGNSIPVPFFRHWILLYMKKPDELLSTPIHQIPKYGSWGDIKTMFINAHEMKREYPMQEALLDRLQAVCVQLMVDQLKQDHQAILKQPDEASNETEEQLSIQKQEWISNCAQDAPRLANNSLNIASMMAKAIARSMHPFPVVADKDERQLKAEKGYAYQLYKRLISAVCHVLEKASPSFVQEQFRSRTRKDRAFLLTKEQREQMLNAPPSTYVTNPEPEPVVPCALEDLQPLLEYLTANQPGPNDEKQPVVFSRGTLMSGGRLDLCKQVVGPRGIQPLLDAMKHSSVVNRLLLGNNIVGLPGAQAISHYIRFNPDSHIDTWYIAGNQFDSECMALICDALATDIKVKALWLKRNPILPEGAVHIARMLTTNRYLQTLDLLNTGLLDDGCALLFNALAVNSTLKHLYIDTNGLTVKSARVIRTHFEEHDNHLETLYLSCNAFGDAGACELAAGLKHDRRLTRLGLASNCIGVEGARALTDALLDHPVLEQLNLGFMKATIVLGGLDNVIGDEGATEISRLIRANQHLRSIDLTFNGLSQAGRMELRDALKENRTLTTLTVVQFGVVHSDLIKEEINTMLETNKIAWGREVLEVEGVSSPSRTDCLRKGEQLNEAVNFPEHIMEIISYYRTH